VAFLFYIQSVSQKCRTNFSSYAAMVKSVTLMPPIFG